MSGWFRRVGVILLVGVAPTAFAVPAEASPPEEGHSRPAPTWQVLLDARVRQIAQGFSGEISLYVRDIAQGVEYGHREEDVNYLSSSIKIVVALEVLRQVDAGLLSLAEEVVLGPGDVRDGVGPIRQRAPGARFTIEQLLELMLVHSDNAAADMLIGRVGVERLESHIEERGIHFGPLMSLLDERLYIYGSLGRSEPPLTPFQVRELGRHDSLAARARELSDMVGRSPPWSGKDLARAFDAFYAAGINSASMRQMGRLLEQVARCDGLSVRSCERLHALMTACKTGKRRILAGVPKEWTWAHKTGTQHRRACDVGVLYVSPERPVVVAACLRKFTRVANAEAVFAQLGEAVRESFGATSASR